MQVIKIFPNLMEAQIALSVLNGNGVEAVILDEASSVLGYGSAVGGVRVCVADGEVEVAKRLLDELPEEIG